MAKLVRVAHGRGIDVVVDIRKDSPTYGHHQKFELSSTNSRIVWVPYGYAHGFLALENNTALCYRTTALYNKSGEGTINPLDSTLAIDWEIDIQDMILSQKDASSQSFIEYTNN
jgi:dTDP-4-dehydrorhamnose 3,5-epimerase